MGSAIMRHLPWLIPRDKRVGAATTMMLVATALAAALLPGAFAIPANDATAMHRALQTTVDANGDNHLYFHSINAGGDCGHIDAAPYMPAELFEPENIVQLFLYTTFTTSLWVGGQLGSTQRVTVGACTNKNNVGGKIYKPSEPPSLFEANWFGESGSLMGPVCADKCGCDFQGLGPADLPACTDAPDDPAKGEFCSLCGPTTACPGCRQGKGVVVELFRDCGTCSAGSYCPPGCQEVTGGPGH